MLKENQKILKVGSRKSPLALIQVREIFDLLNQKGTSQAYEMLAFDTQGDQDKKTPLTTNPADNFFTDSIDDALLKGIVDVGIHSAKDLPQKLHPDLEILAITKSIDDSDSWVSPYAWGELPLNASVGTSSALRQEMLKKLRPDIKCVDIRGTIQERIKLVEEKKIQGIIVATCALKRLKLEHFIKEVLPWEGTALQGQLAVVGRKNDYETLELFQSIDVRQNYGTVYLVGAGPGDPELITIKAIKILEKADFVFYDYLVDPTLLQYAQKAQHIYVGKRKGAHSLSQADLNRMLKQKAMDGKIVVRLKGGDPLIFGRGPSEINYLRSFHIHIEVIPGVSSATGIPSSLGVPLTARGVSSSVAFISGHGEDEQDHKIQTISIPKTDTVVFLMGLTKLEQILKELEARGWNHQTPIMVISRGTMKDEVVVKGTLDTIFSQVKENSLSAPALIIIGQTVDFYNEHRAKQSHILYLGTMPENYKSLGRLIHWPMIAIQPKILSIQEKEQILKYFNQSDLILLTSCYAVNSFIPILKDNFPNWESVCAKSFAVIGQNTSRVLESFGITPTLIAAHATSQGLFEDLKKHMELKGKKILFPRSSIPNPYLKTELTKEGAQVIEIVVYENIKPSKKPLPEVQTIDKIVFTSPSTVKNFLEDYGKIPASWQILSKGPATAGVLKDAGYESAQLIS